MQRHFKICANLIPNLARTQAGHFRLQILCANGFEMGKTDNKQASKQANSKRYNLLDTGMEEASMWKSQKAESPVPHFDTDPVMTLPLMPTFRSMRCSLTMPGALEEQSDCKNSHSLHVRIIPVGPLTPGENNEGSEKPALSLTLAHIRGLNIFHHLFLPRWRKVGPSSLRFGEDVI